MAQPKPYEPNDSERKALGEVEACISEASRWHRPFASRVERRYDAWRGLRDDRVARTWRSEVQQPLLINVVEGMLSSIEEAEPRWRVTPTIVPGITMEEIVGVQENGEIVQHVLAQQMRDDEFDVKQGPFILQDMIAGFTPGKVNWLKEVATRADYEEKEEMVWDEAGGSLDLAVTIEEKERNFILKDGPTFTPRDVRDWLCPESAVTVEASPWIIDRAFVTYDTLLRMEKLGVYKNCQYLQETRIDPDAKDERTSRAAMGTTQSAEDIVQERERRLRNADRTRGLVEIIELWFNDRVITVGNRTVVLRDAPNPTPSLGKPFLTSAAIPDAFSLQGISIIEGLAAMQEMVWTLQNTRLDAARMLANPIQLIRGDVENADDYEWAPLAQWIVTHPDQVKLLEVNPVLAQITMQHEALLKGDIQNVMGGLPYTGGAESQTIDQTTATGISIVTNIAQQILMRRKQQHLRAFGKVGKMFLTLDQRMLRENRIIWVPDPRGKGGRYLEVDWRRLKGAFDVHVEMLGDSMMRQERRAESGALLTQAHQFAPLSAQAGVQIHLDKFWKKHLEAYDIPDPEAYVSKMPAAPAALGAGTQLAPGTPEGADSLLEDMMGGLSSGGTTNAQLAAGPTSPSSTNSMSPVAPMQRAGAATGAGQSV